MAIGADTFPKIWIGICKAWTIVAVGALIMPIVVWIMLMSENIHEFQNVMGTYLGNDQRVYDQFSPTSESGYVNLTNIPKHLGGAVFLAVFSIAMITFCLISLCAELFWRVPVLKNVLIMFWAPGLWNDANMDQIEYYFLISNAFLKLFIVAATGAQSYTGLKPDNATSTGGINTPLFCLYATMILLCSIPFTVIASMFVIQNKKKNEWPEIRAAQDKEMQDAARKKGYEEGKGSGKGSGGRSGR